VVLANVVALLRTRVQEAMRLADLSRIFVPDAARYLEQ
jgi:hypothetical protein